MKRILSILLGLTLFPISGIGIAQAQPSNYLIKGPGDTVYFNSNDGKRYVFPTEAVYKSWYPDFSSVSQISGPELAAIPLAGNVTMRPGYSLVKITTDPKVYAVSHYGILHWLKTEQIAQDLYGTNWNRQVVDVPDTYFTDYVIGYPIESASQYNKSLEMSVSNPGDNIRTAATAIPTQPTAPSTTNPNPAQILMALSDSNAVMNESVNVFVAVSESSLPIKKIEIWSTDSASALSSCADSLSCSLIYHVNSAPQTKIFLAVAYDSNGQKIEMATAERKTLIVSAASDQVQMSVTPQSIPSGSRSSYSSIFTNHQTVADHEIYALIPGQTVPVLWKDCGATSQCSSSSPFYRTTNLYSEVTMGGQTLVSPTVTLEVMGDAPKPTIKVAGKVGSNTSLDITAPSGETIGQTLLKEGTDIDDPTVIMCPYSTCSVTIQAATPASYTAFTLVGGKYEKSNTVTVTP
ncbi:hypothetical protein HZC53_00995 [Candidatus Uhrbacteria bacterium]|nr:hypothetical protein [Candidatus Uhrbacteria bacterium]